MAKFAGKVGYATQIEEEPDVWVNDYVEKPARGDILQLKSDASQSENLNDNIRISNRISIVADAFAFANFFDIKYVIWYGKKLKVTDVVVRRPRIILTVGGRFNE